MSKLNHVYRTIGLAAIGALALAGCGAGGSGASGDSSSKTSICKKEASDKTSIDSAPKADWKPGSLGVKVPSSDEYGPEKTDSNKVPSCFEHSPEGGLFAATQYVVPVLTLDPQLGPEMIRSQGIDNDQREKEAQSFEDQAKGENDQKDKIQDKLQIVGYKLDSYTKDKATYEVLLKSSVNSALGAGTFTVEWKDNDWRFNAGEDDDSKINFKNIESTDGFTKWGPDAEGGSSASSSA